MKLRIRKKKLKQWLSSHIRRLSITSVPKESIPQVTPHPVELRFPVQPEFLNLDGKIPKTRWFVFRDGRWTEKELNG